MIADGGVLIADHRPQRGACVAARPSVVMSALDAGKLPRANTPQAASRRHQAGVVGDGRSMQNALHGMSTAVASASSTVMDERRCRGVSGAHQTPARMLRPRIVVARAELVLGREGRWGDGWLW